MNATIKIASVAFLLTTSSTAMAINAADVESCKEHARQIVQLNDMLHGSPVTNSSPYSNDFYKQIDQALYGYGGDVNQQLQAAYDECIRGVSEIESRQKQIDMFNPRQQQQQQQPQQRFPQFQTR